MNVLDEAAERSFVERLTHEVRTHYADALDCLPEDAVRDLVDAALERAKSFGFSWESSLAAFVHLMFAVAPNFYRHPVVEAVLRDDSIPLERRVAVLPDVVSPSVWEEIVETHDPSAW